MKKIAIIGAGLQARRRVPPIVADENYDVALVIDIFEPNAKSLAETCGAAYGIDWKEVITDESIDAVLVLTFPDTHAEISIAAMEAGKDVLCEKPLARTAEEAAKMVESAVKNKRILKCGFNLRHHPAIAEAHRLFQEGKIGTAAFGRGIYGIAGREDMTKEWRTKPELSGGGEFMDQGVHLIDLLRWFLGDVEQASGMVSTTVWPIEPLEDNGFALLRHEGGVTSSVHTSLTQWVNKFEFEIYGREGFLTISGLGGGYGVEKLIVGHRDPEGLFQYTTYEYRRGDESWQLDWEEFKTAMESREAPSADGVAGHKVLEAVEAVYESSTSGKTINLK